MSMIDDSAVRDLVSRLLAWEDAHVGFDKAVNGIPVALRGKRPSRLPYSPWQLIEHMRITQHDILDFCRNPNYQQETWPEAYWPSSAAPPSARSWTESIRQYRADRRALQDLAADPTIDLAAKIPHGSGQTYLREIILAADHTAYHVGELLVVRRLLGIWKS
ncbi:MAG TPA: DinB family protein [Vicinamibacterales bacterium]|jgi:hypothetical protein